MTPVVNGYSNCVTAACVEMATIYTNMIVECFENRVIAFLVRGIRELFDKVKEKKKKKSYL
jgi:phosphopantetheine adenylyltransferase